MQPKKGLSTEETKDCWTLSSQTGRPRLDLRVINTYTHIYKSNWYIFSTRYEGRFFRYPVLVTLRSHLGLDYSSTPLSYGRCFARSLMKYSDITFFRTFTSTCHSFITWSPPPPTRTCQLLKSKFLTTFDLFHSCFKAESTILTLDHFPFLFTPFPSSLKSPKPLCDVKASSFLGPQVRRIRQDRPLHRRFQALARWLRLRDRDLRPQRAPRRPRLQAPPVLVADLPLRRRQRHEGRQ